MKPIILASASPRRKVLLKKIVKTFKIIPSKINESRIKAKSPITLAKRLALAKALDIAKAHKRSIVIGVDTIVVLGNKILGKPKSKKEAISMLESLSGKTHRVITGIAVVDSDDLSSRVIHAATKVKMKKTKPEEILAYVNSGGPMDKAGGYGIQEIEEIFIEKIDGDYDNVVGLPVLALSKLLKEFTHE
ncbi:MAG: Maf family protein [Candidatus Margulisiibacteriota bacterium]|jgi:septum formation protein